MRYSLKNPTTGEEIVLHLTKEQERDPSHFRDEKTGTEFETVESILLIEWLANNYKSYGATLEFITNRSQEGSQFCKGFGGIGGLLRYRVDFLGMEDEYEDDDGQEGDI